MAKSAVCKFRCMDAPEGGTGEVHLEAEYDEPLSDDDRAFSVATPWGELRATIENPALDGFFETGRDYLVTITPVGD